MYYSGYGAAQQQPYGVPNYGYGCCEPVSYGCGGNNYFAWILVLFILLVIIGCTCYNNY